MCEVERPEQKRNKYGPNESDRNEAVTKRIIAELIVPVTVIGSQYADRKRVTMLFTLLSRMSHHGGGGRRHAEFYISP